jgi:DNA-binding transcriptional LysR family regulator
MTLEQLRIFVAVAERQHVTQAARALNLAQSAMSHAITALEARHDTKLFDRVGPHRADRGGSCLPGRGPGRVGASRSGRTRARRTRQSETGHAARAGESDHRQLLASRHLVVFRQTYPQIQIRLAIGNTAQVAAAVASGTAELGFVEGAVENEHFASTPVARDQLIVVVGPEHPWVGRARLAASGWAALSATACCCAMAATSSCRRVASSSAHTCFCATAARSFSSAGLSRCCALAAFLAGAKRMDWPRFLVFNAAGGMVWASAYGMAAFWLGRQMERLAKPVGIALGVAAVIAIIVLLAVLRVQEAKLE